MTRVSRAIFRPTLVSNFRARTRVLLAPLILFPVWRLFLLFLFLLVQFVDRTVFVFRLYSLEWFETVVPNESGEQREWFGSFGLLGLLGSSNSSDSSAVLIRPLEFVVFAVFVVYTTSEVFVVFVVYVVLVAFAASVVLKRWKRWV